MACSAGDIAAAVVAVISGIGASTVLVIKELRRRAPGPRKPPEAVN